MFYVKRWGIFAALPYRIGFGKKMAALPVVIDKVDNLKFLR